jgi:glucose/arabinose dehydrogenase
MFAEAPHRRKVLSRSFVVAATLGGAAALWSVTAADAAKGSMQPRYDGEDASRPRVPIRLVRALDGLERPVDVAFPPGQPAYMLVVEQPGMLTWMRPDTGARGRLPLTLDGLVTGGGEQGLLGLAVHPDFERNRVFYLNATERAGGRTLTRVTAYRAASEPDWPSRPPTRLRVLLEVEQPYSNHNGGGLEFGPDGGLYVGLGDGGAAGDPLDAGQRDDVLLGKMLRLDVHAPTTGPAPYTVFAKGLRNPWRYTFDPQGRLVVADVGQNRWEEIDLVPRGANLGWRIREAEHCHAPAEACPTSGLLDPIWSYGRTEGVSVTGGEVYSGRAVAALAGSYVFGDYGSGRLWALTLPAEAGWRVDGVRTLGRFGVSISCIVRRPDGELLVCGHGDGGLWQVVPD